MVPLSRVVPCTQRERKPSRIYIDTTRQLRRENYLKKEKFYCENPDTKTVYEPLRDKTNKMACAPSEDSDHPGHPPSLTSLRCALNG